MILNPFFSPDLVTGEESNIIRLPDLCKDKNTFLRRIIRTMENVPLLSAYPSSEPIGMDIFSVLAANDRFASLSIEAMTSVVETMQMPAISQVPSPIPTANTASSRD